MGGRRAACEAGTAKARATGGRQRKRDQDGLIKGLHRGSARSDCGADARVDFLCFLEMQVLGTLACLCKSFFRSEGAIKQNRIWFSSAMSFFEHLQRD